MSRKWEYSAGTKVVVIDRRVDLLLRAVVLVVRRQPYGMFWNRLERGPLRSEPRRAETDAATFCRQYNAPLVVSSHIADGMRVRSLEELTLEALRQ